ncbi:MAG: hypothetical protein HC771_23820 [Synechococcales cyanobacterium CRU_2_2]|nr:hypothetical protein [Synechococcales cyanobacterium CRU_2_2]
MLKRIKEIKQGKYCLIVKYEFETVNSETDEAVWVPNQLQGDVWISLELMDELIQLFVNRIGLEIDAQICTWRSLTWSYNKFGAEVSLKLEVDGDRTPKPVPITIGGIAIGGSDGECHFTTQRESELLQKIADEALTATREIFAQHNRQLELLNQPEAA